MSIQMDLSKKPKRKKDSQFMLDRRDSSVAVVVTHQERPLAGTGNKDKHKQRYRYANRKAQQAT